MSRKRTYYIFGLASMGGGDDFLLENHILENMRYTTATSTEQARRKFKAKFEKEYRESFCLDRATIEEKEKPEKKDEQLRLFD